MYTHFTNILLDDDVMKLKVIILLLLLLMVCWMNDNINIKISC
jgi:hypothetical protein